MRADLRHGSGCRKTCVTARSVGTLYIAEIIDIAACARSVAGIFVAENLRAVSRADISARESAAIGHVGILFTLFDGRSACSSNRHA